MPILCECIRGGVFLKPSTGSSSGRSVMKFNIDNPKHVYVNAKGQELSGAFLQQYGDNWVLQMAIEQHPYLAQFCHSSLNSLRICTYRSVEDEEITILSAAIRIGHEGSVVDNLHAGGGLVGIDVETGKLGHEVYDQYANRTTILNDIDFAHSNFVIPEWNRIVEFCKQVVKLNHHCRLIALDITLDKDNQPRFIEWNVGGYGFSFWIPMMTGITSLGSKTDEIVEYCLKHKKI
ncbi:MAG: hypothetical protein MJZ79_00065 [Paludibacteraceae bacterium]|nr:hypothetical protein [Paludibacteraceae bacterium]